MIDFGMHFMSTTVKPSISVLIVNIRITYKHFLTCLCNSFHPLLPVPHFLRYLLICFLSLEISLYFLEIYINRIIQYVLSCVQSLALSIIILGLIHIFLCIISSFLLIAEQYSVLWMYCCFSILPVGIQVVTTFQQLKIKLL